MSKDKVEELVAEIEIMPKVRVYDADYISPSCCAACDEEPGPECEVKYNCLVWYERLYMQQG
jgi:hypothetical protein